MLAENKGHLACIQCHFVTIEGIGSSACIADVNDEAGYGIDIVHANFHLDGS